MLIAKAACLGQNGHTYDVTCSSFLYMSSNVAATSTSNTELNFTVVECNKLASCSVSKESNKDKKVFHISSSYCEVNT